MRLFFDSALEVEQLADFLRDVHPKELELSVDGLVDGEYLDMPWDDPYTLHVDVVPHPQESYRCTDQVCNGPTPCLPETPVVLTEVNCTIVGAFYYALPPCDPDWGDLIICVDYGPTRDMPGHVSYSVWVQYRGAVFRTYLYTATICVNPESPKIIHEIIDAINNSTTFQRELLYFATTFER